MKYILIILGDIVLFVICIIIAIYSKGLLSTIATMLAGVFASITAAFMFEKIIQDKRDEDFKANKILFIYRVQSYIDNIIKNIFHPRAESVPWDTIFESPTEYIQEINTVRANIRAKRYSTLLAEQDEYVLSLIDFFEVHKIDKTKFNDGIFVFLEKLKCIDELEDYLFKYMNVAPEYRELDKIFYEIKEAIREFEHLSMFNFKNQKETNCFVNIEVLSNSGEMISVREDSYHLKIIFEKFKSLIDKLKKINIVIYICPGCGYRIPTDFVKKNPECNCGFNFNKNK